MTKSTSPGDRRTSLEKLKAKRRMRARQSVRDIAGRHADWLIWLRYRSAEIRDTVERAVKDYTEHSLGQP